MVCDGLKQAICTRDSLKDYSLEKLETRLGVLGYYTGSAALFAISAIQDDGAKLSSG